MAARTVATAAGVGSIYLLGDANLNTLTRFIHERHFRAVLWR